MYDDYIMWFNPGKCVPMSQDPIVSFTHIVKLKGYIMVFDTTDCVRSSVNCNILVDSQKWSII